MSLIGFHEGGTMAYLAASAQMQCVPSDVVDATSAELDRGFDWNVVVPRYDGLVRATARRYGLQNCDVDDVSQTVWLLLFQHAGNLRNRDCVPGWLKTTASRESLRVLQTSARETGLGDD